MERICLKTKDGKLLDFNIVEQMPTYGQSMGQICGDSCYREDHVCSVKRIHISKEDVSYNIIYDGIIDSLIFCEVKCDNPFFAESVYHLIAVRQ